MIFVTVGTQKFQFNRLLKKIDELVSGGIINDTIFAQIGNSSYIPQNYSFISFLSKDEFENKLDECDIIITHSGVATIVAGLIRKKAIIVMPRLSKYNEHVDDHQIQITHSFAEKNYVLECKEDDELSVLIDEAKSHKFEQYVSQRDKMIDTIRDFICSISG